MGAAGWILMEPQSAGAGYHLGEGPSGKGLPASREAYTGPSTDSMSREPQVGAPAVSGVQCPHLATPGPCRAHAKCLRISRVEALWNHDPEHIRGLTELSGVWRSAAERVRRRRARSVHGGPRGHSVKTCPFGEPARFPETKKLPVGARE